MLTLAGERKQEKRDDSEKVHRIERFYGSFARRFALPENADEQGIRAESRDGVIADPHPEAEGSCNRSRDRSRSSNGHAAGQGRARARVTPRRVVVPVPCRDL